MAMNGLATRDGLTLVGVTRERNGRCKALAHPGERMIGAFQEAASRPMTGPQLAETGTAGRG